MLSTSLEVRRRQKRKVTGTLEFKNPKIAICFDEETFGEVAKLAERRNVTFASIVRTLVAEGLQR